MRRCPYVCVLRQKFNGDAACRYALPSGECALVCVDVNGRHTLAQIGAHLGLTRERVRQIEASAIRKLRRNLALAKHKLIDGYPTSGVSVAEQFEEVPL